MVCSLYVRNIGPANYVLGCNLAKETFTYLWRSGTWSLLPCLKLLRRLARSSNERAGECQCTAS
jgi:hypothetical protein